MEISTVSLSSSFPRPPPSLPFSSSNSLFFNPNSSLFSKPRTGSSLVLSRTSTRTERPKKGLSCTCLFGLGVPELVVIAGVVALVFGPKKLPEVGKSIGKTVKSFQQAAKEFESELKKEPEPELKKEPESLPDPPNKEKPTALGEEDKQDATVSSSKESL